MKRNFLSLLVLSNIFFLATGQISTGGTPLSFIDNQLTSISEVQNLPVVDEVALKNEDEVTDLHKEAPWRFGIALDVNFNLKNSGQWEALPNGDRVWRLAVKSTDAISLNFNFSKFYIPSGGSLYIYNKDKTDWIGGFTTENNREDSLFATNIVKGEEVILEYYEPRYQIGQGRIELKSVVHAYRSLDKAASGFGDSKFCHVNITCPEGDAWQNEKRSVVLILLANNTSVCSGVLLNNTLEDGTPYVLTANHCPINTTNIFVFNYESAQCTPPINGSTDQSIMGCHLRANNSTTFASDFNLVELTSKPLAEYGVYYSGWSKLDQPSTSSVGIHHPRGDVMKISLDYDRVQSTGYYTTDGEHHWAVLNWDVGTTEDGSSGSALFNQQHRVVGQLHGGDASCFNDTVDYYGKFSYSWDNESDSAKQLEYWLDPNNSGVAVLDGYDPNNPRTTLDAQIASIGNFDKTVCSDSIYPVIKIKNVGSSVLRSLELISELNGQKDTFQWIGNLSTNQIADVSLPARFVATGDHYYLVSANSPNGLTDQNKTNNWLDFSFFSVENPTEIELVFKTDDYGHELFWELRNVAGTLLESKKSFPSAAGGDTFIEKFCLYDGCFTFKVFDSFGDGFCCANGNGFYLLRDVATGDTIDYNDNFSGFQDSTNFCVGDSCTILVRPNIRFVSEIGANDGRIDIEVLAGNPPFTFNWNTGGNTSEITDLDTGTYVVTVTDNLGCSGVFEYQLKLSTGIYSLDEIAFESRINIYPNPSTGVVYIDLSNKQTFKGELIVYSIIGKEKMRKTIQPNSGTKEIDLSSLDKGIYLLEFSMNGERQLKKLILQ